MKVRHNLGELEWMLSGWTPWVWRQQRSLEAGVSNNAEVPGVPARVPGSVQGALREADVIPDWNVALNARLCEWVENRHWVYTVRLPDAWLFEGAAVRLVALGLDYQGWVLVNGKEAGRFTGSFVPHTFDLSPHLRDRENTLQIVFDCPPRWLGQIGYTSQMKEWKPRFNYFWDWTARLVQIGIWDDLFLEVVNGPKLENLDCQASIDPLTGLGVLHVRATIRHLHREPPTADGERQTLTLARDGLIIREAAVTAEDLAGGIEWRDLPIELWWPNGFGDQPVYDVRCRLLAPDGAIADEKARRVGFRTIGWEQCEGAPAGADPWLCVVNGQPTFLQGVNWTPIRPNFADVTDEQYRHLLEMYRDLGCTLLRVWGGAFLEKQVFYDLCDELGLLVWQEFPLSSSGLDNWPPEDERSIEEMARIAESYIRRRRHHPSLLLWCGGNELTGPAGEGGPVDLSHPLIARLAQVVARHDPERRFLPSSPSGPSFSAGEEDFGREIHWDVHGPWHISGDLEAEWLRYWEHDDSLFRSEVGCSGASPVDIIRRYKGDLPEIPGTRANPLWRRNAWWVEWPVFVQEQGREPRDLEEYVSWSQERQRRALHIAASACKRRFPRCGGFLVWMGHDSFPCTANLSIVDFDGRPKPAAIELGKVFRES